MLLLVSCAADNVSPSQIETSPNQDAQMQGPGDDGGAVSISLKVTPNQATYAIGKELTIEATVTRDGVTTRSDGWTVTPPDFGVRVSDTALRLTDAGSGAIELCAGTICEEVPIFVVDQPTIQLIYPKRGEMIQLDGSSAITVAGKLENMAMSFPTVLVNNEPAQLSDNFEFSIEMAIQQGLNTIEIVVQDPTLDTPPTLFTSFLAAQNYLSAQTGPLRIQDALTVYLREALLDDDLPRSTIEPGMTVQARDVVQFLDVIVQTSDPLRFLPDPLTTLEGLDLEITAIDFGEFDGDIKLPAHVAEADFAMTDAKISTEGSVQWNGTNLSLDGYLTASLAAFLVLDGSIEDTILLDLQEIEAELLSVSAHYESETLNSLIEALDSDLTEQVIDLLTSFIKDLFRQQAMPLVRYSFEEMLAQIKVLPIVVESPLEGLPSVNLTAEVKPRAMELYQAYAGLYVDVEISGLDQPYPHEGDLGVFVSPAYPTPGNSNEPLTLAVKLDLLNALCHAIWKTGILNVRPALPTIIQGLVDAVDVNAKLPPIIEFRSGETNRFNLTIGELQLAVTPKGSTQADLYVLHLEVPAILTVSGGFISLNLEGDPSIRVDTLLKSGTSSIDADTIETLLLNAVYPLFSQTLSDGLTYGIDAIPIDQSIVNEISPQLAELILRPSIASNFKQDQGIVTVGGELSAEARRRLEPPSTIE